MVKSFHGNYQNRMPDPVVEDTKVGIAVVVEIVAIRMIDLLGRM